MTACRCALGEMLLERRPPSERIMKLFNSVYFSATLVLGFSSAGVAQSLALTENEAAIGRTVMENHVGAVVNVEITVLVRLPSRDRDLPPREQKIEVNGTMLNAAGVTVIPLSSADPRPVIGRIGPSGPPGQETAETTIAAIKLRLPDGSELSAKLLGKDTPSALAFIGPEEPIARDRKFSFLNLERSSPAALLQTCILVARTPPSHHAVPLARITYVTGIFEKPIRSLMIPDLFTGTPVFTTAGELIGIATAYLVENRPVTAVVVPADEVTKAMQRALSSTAN